MSFQDRLALATPHEHAVKVRLEGLRWLVEWFGQGQFSPGTQAVLRKRRTSLRWFPDLLAVKDGPIPRLCFVDAKETTPKNRGSDNYAVEEESVRALELVAGATSILAVYVMHDFRVVWTHEIRKFGRWLPGTNDGAGSGTPYFLISKQWSREFDKAFGRTMTPTDTTPAAVRSAADLQAELHAAFLAFEESGRCRLEAALRIGAILADRKAAVGHGNWLKWLAAHFPYGRERAADFLRVHANRSKCGRAATFEEALSLCRDEPEPADEPDEPKCNRAVTFDPPEEPEAEPEPAGEDETPLAEPTDEPEPEEPAAPPPQDDTLPQPSLNVGKVPVPSYFKPGNHADPDHPFADILAKFTALTAALTKACRDPDDPRLKAALTQLSAVTRKTHMVAYTSEVIDNGEVKGGTVKFIGLGPLRHVVRKAGKLKKPMNAEQVAKAFDEANDPTGKEPQE